MLCRRLSAHKGEFEDNKNLLMLTGMTHFMAYDEIQVVLSKIFLCTESADGKALAPSAVLPVPLMLTDMTVEKTGQNGSSYSASARRQELRIRQNIGWKRYSSTIEGRASS